MVHYLTLSHNSETLLRTGSYYINNLHLNIRVFYVGSKNDAFMATPIVAFADLKTCVLMAFVYATIEYVIDYICKPRPIYILAPLRDTGSYYFQAVNLDRFIPLHCEPSEIRLINSEGIGITPRFSKPKSKEKLVCTFANQIIKSSCCCAIIYRDNKLLVFRGTGFVEKTNINHQLVQYCYGEYMNRREKCRRCSSVHTEGKTKCNSNGTLYCDYVFRKTDALANKNAKNNPTAKQLLLELIVVACKEDISDYDNLYVLENGLMEGIQQSFSFTIYLFNKDLSALGCPKEWLSVGENIVSVEENDVNEARIMSTTTDTTDTIQYRAYIIASCNALELRRAEALNKWSAYRTMQTGTNASVADQNIKNPFSIISQNCVTV